MEVDELKNIWKEQYRGSTLEDSESKARLLITRSRKSINENFVFELIVAFSLIIGFTVLAIFFEKIIWAFLYKMVLIVGIFSVPIYFRIYRSLKFMRRIDYGTDLRTNLTKFLIHYKMSLHFYKWGTYFLVITLLVVFYFDDSFRILDFWIKTSVVVYFLLIALFVDPLVNRFYGNKIRSIEAFFSE